jgi:lipopolysaccharide export LptBFGC system permease protein LptF
MENKESFQVRLKKDLAFFVLILMLASGPLSVYAAKSPYVGYVVLGMVVLTFGPYVIEYTQIKLTTKDKSKIEKIDEPADGSKDIRREAVE